MIFIITSINSNTFIISNSQWLAANEHRDKYDIIFVLESEEDNPPRATINNPYQQWLDKKIEFEVYLTINISNPAISKSL